MTIKKGDILLEKYRIEKCRLGPGAYSNVYLATHLDLKVPRALKILRKGYEDGLGSQDFADYAERFRLEAQLGAKLDHPNIVRVYDFESSSEQLVLVMEYCAGGSLAEVIELLRDKERLLPIKEVLQIAEQVASGLAELHKKQIVHRDLKPANILLDKNGTAKVADLGLAQVPGGPSMRSRLSEPMPHPGTPGYMSPEQEKGTGILTPASDIYAFGLVLFELLTGNAYSFLRPGTRALEIRANTPIWLNDLLIRMLASNPQERPWNGNEIIQALRDGEEQEKVRRKSATEEEEKHRQAEEESRIKSEEQARLETGRQAYEAEEKQKQVAGKSGIEESANQQKTENEQLRTTLENRQDQPAFKNQKTNQKKMRKSWLGWVVVSGGLLTLLVGMVVVALLAALDRNKVDPEGTVEPVVQTTQTATVVIEEEAVFTEEDYVAEQDDKQETAQENLIIFAGISYEILSETMIQSTKDGMVQVYVPAGEFEMGASTDQGYSICQEYRNDCDRSWFEDEEPVHKVYLDAYWIDQTEVTNAMYAMCVADGACDKPGGGNYADSAYAEHPVVNVSWYDSENYCAWAGRELPTEAEWEKAARGTDGRIYSWGDSAPDCSLAQYWRCHGGTIEVGSLTAGVSPYGAMDLTGNVWEWVSDWYEEDYYSFSPEKNPENINIFDYKVLRGGSWNSFEYSFRSAFRHWDNPLNTDDYYGFRCVVPAP